MNNTISIPVPGDSEGFILLECPLCGNRFKLIISDIEKAENIFCPSCGMQSSNYATAELKELATTRVRNLMKEEIFSTFKELEKTTKNSCVSFKAGKRPELESEPPLRNKYENMVITTFDCCDKTAKIKPLLRMAGSYCPFCGEKNMNLDGKELRKIINSFNRVSERLMHTDFADFTSNVYRFVSFIDSTELIKGFIDKCGAPSFVIEEEFREVCNNQAVFDIGIGEGTEVANTYAILHYIADNNINSRSMAFYNYSHGSNQYQDWIDGFNSRVTFILISHIDGFLTEVGYEMELDQQPKSISNNFYGSVNSVGLQQGDHNTMNINNGMDFEELHSILSEIMKNRDSFESVFEEKTVEFNEKMDELISLVEKKENPTLIKKLLKDVKEIAIGVGGNVIAAGIVALINNYI